MNIDNFASIYNIIATISVILRSAEKMVDISFIPAFFSCYWL